MAEKIRIGDEAVISKDYEKSTSLRGRTLEWKWLIPFIDYWRLMDGDEVLASIRKKTKGGMGARNLFYVARLNNRRIEIRLQHPKWVDYHPSHKKNYPPDAIAVYSIESVRTEDASDTVKARQKIGKLEHRFGPHLSPARFVLDDCGQYDIELMFENKDKRGYRISSDEDGCGSRVIAVASRTRTNREYRTFDPGTFRLLDYRDGDPNAMLMAVIGFAFADIVHFKYDWGLIS
jgi:hypothetical protein